MAMALKAEVSGSSQSAGIKKPIDLVYLSVQTMGDIALEMEILKMFSAQITHYTSLINSSINEEDVRRAAHTIKGAAQSVGAFRLAELSYAAEESGHFDTENLLNEMSEIENYISEISET